MKIQSLAIIFVIIVLPITIIIGEYASVQIETFRLEQLYDSRLINATQDGLKAFQINTFNDAASDIADSKLSSIEASVNAFYNSIKSSFELEGYTEEDLKSYVPALVYTMYDGYYIYSPYTNVATADEENGLNINLDSDNIEYGFKPYVYYSCRYKMGSDSDFIINYALDNYITVQGIVNGESVYKSGYLLTLASTRAGEGVFKRVLANGIEKYYYCGKEIAPESNLTENIVEKDNNGNIITKEYKYFKLNGTKYYWNEEEEYIFYIMGGNQIKQVTKASNKETYYKYVSQIEINSNAVNYYKSAYEFTKWINDNLGNLKASHAQSNIENKSDYKIFNNNKIEYTGSNFNMHRKDVIRYSIESNLSVAIANFNQYTTAGTNFQMPKLKETEWELVQNEISVISFLQGLNIGGKVYNGYTVINNSKTEEVVKEERIYMATSDNYYHKINDKHFVNGRNLEYDASQILLGILDLDLEIRKDAATGTYYTNQKQLGCYKSIVGQENVDNKYDSIYEYLSKTNIDDVIKQKYYTALGRERWSSYKIENVSQIDKVINNMQPDNDYEESIVTDGLIRHLSASNGDGYGNAYVTGRTIWKDLSGHRDGIVYGNPNSQHSAVEFDGQDDWVDLGIIESDTLTLEATVEFSRTGSYIDACVLNNHQYGGMGILVRNNKILGQVYINGRYRDVWSDYTIKYDTIYNISLTYDGQIIKLYIYADEDLEIKEYRISGKISNPQDNTVMAIGVNPWKDGVEGQFGKMKVRSIRVYNRGLTQEEIEKNYNLGKLVKITHISAVPSKWSKNGVDVHITAVTLDERGMDAILYKSGETWGDYSWSESTLSDDGSTLTVKGTWNKQHKDDILYFKAVDNMGNESSIATIMIRNDTLKPEIESLTQVGNNIHVIAKDQYLESEPTKYSGIEKIEYTFGDGNWYSDTWKELTQVGDDEHVVTTYGNWNSNTYRNKTLYARAIDYAGNISEAKSVTIRGPVTMNLQIKVDGENYNSSKHGYIGVNINFGDGYSYRTAYNRTVLYGNKWEINRIRIGNYYIPYSMTGTVGENDLVREYIIVNISTVSFKSSNTLYGSVSPEKLYVPNGTTFTTSGNKLTFSDGREVTATTKQQGTFKSWEVTSGTITGKRTIMANFAKGVVETGLVANYDAKNNTGSGHSNTTTEWTNLAGETNSGQILGKRTGEKTFKDDYIELDGIDDYINLGRISSLSSGITLETTAEIISTRLPRGGNEMIMGNFEDGGVGLFYGSRMGGGFLRFAIYIEGQGYVHVETTITQGQKYNISATYDGATIKLYVDGVLKASKNVSGTPRNSKNYTSMVMGANPRGANSIDKDMMLAMNVYSTRIYERALTQSEINANINATN